MNTPKKILLLSLLLLLPGCVVTPAYRERVVVSGPGVYTTLPAGYAGPYYLYGGRYYYGGRHDTGRFYWRGRYYSDRYYHRGQYIYGGSFSIGR